MPFWPVATREARIAARAPRTYAWRAIVTAVGIATIPSAIWLARSAPSLGRPVFMAISTMAFVYCLFGGVVRTADAIAEEKRENTLGLLFLTDLKAGDVISGKLLASTATLFFGLLALLPLLGIPLLLGGVTSREMALMALCLVNSLFFSISCGFLISTFFRQGWLAISAGLAAMLFVCALVPLVSELVPFLIVVSPIVMLAAIYDNALAGLFWQSLIVTHLIAWLNILYTAHYLPRFWQDRPRSVKAQRWWERLRRLRLGGEKTRKKFRTRLLNTNPLFWLSGREQVSSGGLMLILLFIAFLSLISGWREVLFGLIAMHAALQIRMASAGSHALAEDRKSGALELLLATSLTVGDVLKGRWMALGRQFFGPMLIVTIWHLFTILWISVMGSLAELTDPLMAAGPALMLSWVAVGWYGLWMGLRARHPIAAIWGTLAAVLLAPWIAMGGLFSLLASFQLLPEMRTGNAGFLSIGVMIWVGYLLLLIAWTSRRVWVHFREAAADRFSDTQPIDWRPIQRRTLQVAAAVALVVGGIYATRGWINWRGDRALQRMLAAHPDFQLAPVRPYVPPQQNLAQWDFLRAVNDGGLNRVRVSRSNDPPTLAKEMLRSQYNSEPLQLWRKGESHPFISDNKLPMEVQKKYDVEVARLHAAARERPYMEFTLSSDPMTQMSIQFPMNSLAKFFAARAEALLGAGERPLDDVLLALRFANAITNDPTALPSKGYQNALFHCIQPIYDGLALGRWTDSDLQTIQRAFEKMDAFAHYQLWRDYALRRIVAAVDEPVDSLNPQIWIAGTRFYSGQQRQPARLPGKIKTQKREILRVGLEELRHMAGPTARTVDPNVSFYGYDGPDYLPRLKDIVRYSVREGVRVLAPTQTAIDQVTVACAIERYRLAEGKLPATLEQLVPKYISKLPKDIMTGRPLIYRLEGNGYRLYSVALDGVDQNGQLESTKKIGSREEFKAGDWAWIYKK